MDAVIYLRRPRPPSPGARGSHPTHPKWKGPFFPLSLPLPAPCRKHCHWRTQAIEESESRGVDTRRRHTVAQHPPTGAPSHPTPPTHTRKQALCPPLENFPIGFMVAKINGCPLRLLVWEAHSGRRNKKEHASIFPGLLYNIPYSNGKCGQWYASLIRHCVS